MMSVSERNREGSRLNTSTPSAVPTINGSTISHFRASTMPRISSGVNFLPGNTDSPAKYGRRQRQAHANPIARLFLGQARGEQPARAKIVKVIKVFEVR